MLSLPSRRILSFREGLDHPIIGTQQSALDSTRRGEQRPPDGMRVELDYASDTSVYMCRLVSGSLKPMTFFDSSQFQF